MRSREEAASTNKYIKQRVPSKIERGNTVGVAPGCLSASVTTAAMIKRE
jgi:hypothetical protein